MQSSEIFPPQPSYQYQPPSSAMQSSEIFPPQPSFQPSFQPPSSAMQSSEIFPPQPKATPQFNFAPPTPNFSPSRSKYLNSLQDFNQDDLNIIDMMNYVRPNDFPNTDTSKLENISEELKNDIRYITYQINGYMRKKNKDSYDNLRLDGFNYQKSLMKKYKNSIDVYLKWYKSIE